jgi:hypothetical protein
MDTVPPATGGEKEDVLATQLADYCIFSARATVYNEVTSDSMRHASAW